MVLGASGLKVQVVQTGCITSILAFSGLRTPVSLLVLKPGRSFVLRGPKNKDHSMLGSIFGPLCKQTTKYF